MTVGLVHDYLLILRGAERTFAAMADVYPDAPIYTLLHDPAGLQGRFDGRDVTTSFLQRLGVRQDDFRRLLPLFPTAAERLPVGGHDVVLSSSSAFAHGVRPRAGATHVCYCHSPFRYAWFERERAAREVPTAARLPLELLLARARRWDRKASTRVTRYVANSEITRERIAHYLGRDAEVVHPPVEVERFSAAEPEDSFLIVCELVRHKQVDLALEAVKRAGGRVKVVGSGPDRERLETLHGDVAEFLGRVDDAALTSLHARARALIVPNVEEFGIAAVEAQAAGRPVAGADAGGTRETVVPGRTGVLVRPGDVDQLTEALRETDWTGFDPAACRRQAELFSTERFQQRLAAQVDAAAVGG